MWRVAQLPALPESGDGSAGAKRSSPGEQVQCVALEESGEAASCPGVPDGGEKLAKTRK